MTLSEKIESAVKTIKALDLKNLEVGKYPVNEDFYYLIQEYESKPVENCKLEAHQNYVDIQYVIDGYEAVDVRDVSKCEALTEYNPEKDVRFYKLPETMQRVELHADSYVVLLPETAHMPQIAIDGKPVKVKKCVGKVRV